MDVQCIHLNSVITMLRDPEHGVAMSLYGSPESHNTELSSQFFVHADEGKLAYVCSRFPIGTRSSNTHLCNMNCQYHPENDGTYGAIQAPHTIDEYRGVRPRL